MSDTDHFLHLNQTSPIMPIEEIYNITRGVNKIGNLKGYQIPSTPQYSPRSFKFPTEKKKDMVYEVSKRAKDPDPTLYSPKAEDLQKKFWNPPDGKFFKNPRKTVTEEVMKNSKKIPGPGEYMQVPKGKSQSMPRALLGKFEYFLYSKDKDTTFLNEICYQAEQTPGSPHYYSKLEDRDKAVIFMKFSKIEPKMPIFKYHPDKVKKVKDKDLVGPGYLKDLEANYHKRSLTTATPQYGVPKAKIVRRCEEVANRNKWVPGVGQYKEKERAFTSYMLEKKTRMPYISKYKDVRFTEALMKTKNWVPGPGSYDISFGPSSPRK